MYYLWLINVKTFYMQFMWPIKLKVHIKFRREPYLKSNKMHSFASNAYKVLITLINDNSKASILCSHILHGPGQMPTITMLPRLPKSQDFTHFTPLYVVSQKCKIRGFYWNRNEKYTENDVLTPLTWLQLRLQLLDLCFFSFHVMRQDFTLVPGIPEFSGNTMKFILTN